jgi:DHA2 family multidrug resistance protein-like MFS transporter
LTDEQQIRDLDHAVGGRDVTATPATRAWWALALLTVPCVVVVMDLTVLFLAMPSIVPDLGASATAALWITDVYGFLIAATLLTMGSLADRLGRSRALIAGATGFAVASAAAALAPSAGLLIVARGVQGLAGAALIPSAMALAYALFPDERRRSVAMAVLMGSFAAGAALGPVLGGLLLVTFHWSAVFWLNVPLMAAVVLAGRRLLPAVPGDRRATTDPVSVVLSVLGILGTVYGAKRVTLDGVDAAGLLALGAGAAALAAFAVRQRRLAVPVLDLALFRIRGFSLGLVTNVLTSFVMFGVSMLLALYLQLTLGLSPLLAALANLPGMTALVLATSLIPRLARRLPARILVGGGSLLVAAGALMLTRLDGADDLPWVIVANIVMSAGVAPTTVLVTQIIVGAAPQRATGTASGAAQAANELGGALGIALLGGLTSAVYRLTLDRAPGVDGYRSPDTYAGLLGASGDKSPALLAAARTAFVDGVTASMLTTST